MRLLPKSIHRCRRYPTKFNSGRDISFFCERRRAGYRRNVTPRSLDAILRYLEAKGVVSLPESVVPRSAGDDLLDEYEQFLVKERGLQASTARGYYRSYAKKFRFSCRFGGSDLCWRAWPMDAAAIVENALPGFEENSVVSKV